MYSHLNDKAPKRLTFLVSDGSLFLNFILGLLMNSQKTETLKKVKTTVYMSEKDDSLLNEVFIKRLRERKKTDRSTLLCEGIRLLYEKEIGAPS